MLPERLLKEKCWLRLAILVLVIEWSIPVIAQGVEAESHQVFSMIFALGWAGLMVGAGLLFYHMARESPAVASLAIVVAVASLALLYRTPGIFFEPQFMTEDATVFFAQQHELGWGALLLPYHGYYHTVVRILAALIGPVPTLFVPAFYSLAWLGIFSLVVGYILFRYPDRKWAPVMALVPAFVSHTCEVFLVMTYTSWIGGLALTALVLFPAPKIRGWIHGIVAVFILVFSLSGPFGVVLAPVYFLRWIAGRKTFPLIYVVAVALGAVIQLTALHSYYVSQPPGIPFTLPVLLLCLQIAVIRVPWSLAVGYQPQESYWLIGLVVVLVLFGFIAWEIKSNLRKHIFPLACFSLGAIFVIASLRRISPLEDLVPLLNGDRYFYVPKILFVWALIHLAATARNPKPYYLALLLCVMGAIVEFNAAQVVVDNHWPRYANLIDEGQTVEMPVNPPGWTALIQGRNDGAVQK